MAARKALSEVMASVHQLGLSHFGSMTVKGTELRAGCLVRIQTLGLLLSSGVTLISRHPSVPGTSVCEGPQHTPACHVTDGGKAGSGNVTREQLTSLGETEAEARLSPPVGLHWPPCWATALGPA